jgi:hypothetical protein
MRRNGLFLTFLLSLSAYAIVPLPASPAGLDPVLLTATTSWSSTDGYGTLAYGEAAETQAREWLHIHGTLNVRAEPRQSAAIIRTLQRGDSAQLGPKDANGWARVYSPGSGEGYVYRASELVQRQAPSARSAASWSRGSGDAGSRRASSGGGSRRSNGGRVYHTGPRGGCYYYTGSGRKQYVDRSNCR